MPKLYLHFPIASTSKALRSDMGHGDYEEMEHIMSMDMENIMLICQDRAESVSWKETAVSCREKY